MYFALGADEATHVLYHSQNGEIDFAAEVHLLPDILQRHLLHTNTHTHVYTVQHNLNTRSLHSITRAISVGTAEFERRGPALMCVYRALLA